MCFLPPGALVPGGSYRHQHRAALAGSAVKLAEGQADDLAASATTTLSGLEDLDGELGQLIDFFEGRNKRPASEVLPILQPLATA